MEAGLSLGSNLGDRLAKLQSARDAIAALPEARIVAQAPIYETDPVGVNPEYAHLKFLNTVLILTTTVSPQELQRQLTQVETDLGRRRGVDRFAPREIDIDLLYAGDVWMETEQLTLPHPRWAQRRFVVQPLSDVRPELVLPGVGRTVRQILETLPPGERVRLFMGPRNW